MSNSTLAPIAHTFQSHTVHTVDDNGELWFLANDVCAVLGYANPRQAIQKNCKEKGVSIRDTLTKGGTQSMVYINEPNLYRLIIKSHKPEAEAFEAWVMEELLPSIRKTGRYSVDDEDDDNDDYQPTEYEMAIKRANSIIPMVMEHQYLVYEHDKVLHQLAPLRGIDNRMVTLNRQMQFLLSYLGLDNDYSHNSSGDDSEELKNLFDSKHKESIREHCRQFFRNYVLLRVEHGWNINHSDDPEQLAINLAQYFQLCYEHHLPNFGQSCEPVTTVAGLNNMHQLQTMLKSPDNCAGRFLKCAKIPSACERLPFGAHGRLVDCLIFECDVKKLVGIIADRDPLTIEMPRC